MNPKIDQQNSAYKLFTLQRRRLLRGFVLLGATSLLPGCSTRQTEPFTESKGPTIFTLPELKKFLLLSQLLTGYDKLEEHYARLYLASLRRDPLHSSGLDGLYAQGGFNSDSPPRDLDALTASGVFAHNQLREVADKITIAWYSGIYQTTSGPQVATHENALCWRALTFTKPPSVCGGALGFWSKAPTA